MSTLKELRNRIKTIKSTSKITAAMKMVAAAKVRRYQDRLTHAAVFSEHYQKLLQYLIHQDPDITTPYIREAEQGTHLIIVFSPEKGLCGGYHNAVIKEAKRLIHQQPDCDILALTSKGARALGRVNTLSESFIVASQLTMAYATALSDILFKKFQDGSVRKITLVGGHFKNILRQEVVVRQLLPFLPSPSVSNDFMLTDTPLKDLLPIILQQALAAELHRFLWGNATCEQAARMAAMDNATRNAKEMLDNLQLTYNQTRQACITRELIEIISGAGSV